VAMGRIEPRSGDIERYHPMSAISPLRGWTSGFGFCPWADAHG
jgi:hypothetical protein